MKTIKDWIRAWIEKAFSFLWASITEAKKEQRNATRKLVHRARMHLHFGEAYYNTEFCQTTIYHQLKRHFSDEFVTTVEGTGKVDIAAMLRRELAEIEQKLKLIL